MDSILAFPLVMSNSSVRYKISTSMMGAKLAHPMAFSILLPYMILMGSTTIAVVGSPVKGFRSPLTNHSPVTVTFNEDSSPGLNVSVNLASPPNLVEIKKQYKASG